MSGTITIPTADFLYSIPLERFLFRVAFIRVAKAGLPIILVAFGFLEFCSCRRRPVALGVNSKGSADMAWKRCTAVTALKIIGK